jgi:hypothetical protein
MYMNYITTTQLRTHTKEFIKYLLCGDTIQIIHRSKIIGTAKLTRTEPFEEKVYAQLAKEFNLPKKQCFEILACSPKPDHEHK